LLGDPLAEVLGDTVGCSFVCEVLGISFRGLPLGDKLGNKVLGSSLGNMETLVNEVLDISLVR
jgi:hypothetical protein